MVVEGGSECPFARLGLERRPVVCPEELREAYLREARVAHPDAASGSEDAFESLRVAREKLASEASRLGYLAELRGGGRAISPDASLFELVAPQMTAAEQALAALAGATTSLGRVTALAAAGRALQSLPSARQYLEAHRAGLEARLADLDKRWPDVPPAELAELASGFRFCDRWLEKLKEVEFRLRQGTAR